MNVASLELCKELYEVSGWEPDRVANYISLYVLFAGKEWIHGKYLREMRRGDIPAYDLGYLLRKLQADKIDHVVRWVNDKPTDKIDQAIKEWHGNWISGTLFMPFKDYFIADTPEDATCKLAIELFKQGILTKDAA